MRADWRSEVHAFVDGRSVIVIGGPLAALTPRVAMVRRLGAAAVLAIGHGRGTGDLPDPDHAVSVLVEPDEVADIGAQFAADEALVVAPPATVCRAIDAFDPARRAVVFALPMLGALPDAMYGRPIIGHRRTVWCALEDKLVVGDLWQAAGVAHPLFEIVRSDLTSLQRAAAELDRGEGTVWAADAIHGWHGGAEGTRWVRSAADADEAFGMLARRAERVRVMPFIEGIPCSVMGIVFPSGVAALRPVENVVLRASQAPVFRYGGVASWWDPPAADRAAMMDVARRVGSVLAARENYRGAFTVDGILGVDGFVPTELNPRIGASAMWFERAVPDLPLEMLNRALVAGSPCAVDARDFEAEVNPILDAYRVGGSWMGAATGGRQAEYALRYDRGRFRRATRAGVSDATIVTGPGVGGGRIEFRPGPSIVNPGMSVAPLACQAFAWADAELGTGIGPLTSALDVRDDQHAHLAP